MKKWLLMLAVAGLSSQVQAAQTEPATTVASLRPYAGGAYIQVVDGSLCGTTVFLVDFAVAATNKVVYATLLTAFVAGKKVQLEAGSCTGWGSRLASITILD